LASENPKSGALLLFLAKFQLETGDRGHARATLALAKEADPKNPDVDLTLAQLDSEDGRLNEARETLKRVVESSPRNVMAQLWLGNVEEMKGNHEAAIQHYRQVISATPDNATALNNLAYVLAEYGKQPDEALKYAERAKELQPDNASVNDTLGWVYYQKALYPMAVRHLESAVATQPTGKRKYHLAMACLKAGDARRARQMLTEALKADPSFPEAQQARQLLSQPM
jgi:Tfp pilus assembly protein PilF